MTKRSLILGTAGHIDHGKSALVLALTGTDPDRLKEEKARGITIELGFAHAAIGDLDVSFVDVPGHERFVRTMLAGVGGIDAVLLVIAADEAVMPQTREHLAICKLIGIERGIIALTKSDLADAETCAVAALEVRALVEGSFLASAPIVPVSARTGAGLDALREAIAVLGAAPPREGRRQVVRLPVDRTFSIKGFGTVATGTLVSGRISKGDELEILPAGRRARVRGVQVHGREAPEAVAPRRAAVNLAAVDVDALGRGVTLATPGAFRPTRSADVRIAITGSGDRPDPRAPAAGLRHGSGVLVYHGTSEIAARVAVAAIREAGERTWQRARVDQPGVTVPPGGEAFVRLRFAKPAVLTRLDRLVLRAYSPAVTIGGGVVLDPAPPGSALRRPTTLDRFEALDAEPRSGEIDWAQLARVAAVWALEAGDRGFDVMDLVRRAGVDRPEAEKIVAGLVGDGRLHLLDGRVFDAAAARRIEAAALAAKAALKPSPTTPADDSARAQIEDVVRHARLTPPDADTIAQAANLPRAVVDRLVVALVRDGHLVRLGPLVFHREPLAALKAEVKALGAGASAKVHVDVAAFKTRYGISRKYAIPLLEWLDRERVTRRVGEARVVI